MSLAANIMAPNQLSQPPKPPQPLTFTPPIKAQPISHNHGHYRPVVKWTSSMAKLCRDGHLSEAVKQFADMTLSGVEPTHVTLVTLLSGCANFPPATVSLGASLHGYARKLGLDANNVMVGTAIVDMYAKSGLVHVARSVFDGIEAKNLVSWNTMVNGYMRNGEIESAVQMFDEMPERDRISWTAMIGGFTKSGRYEEALSCFREMQLAGVGPDYVTVMAALSACADLGTIGFGLWVNRLALDHGLETNVKVNNSLIEMYSRCGCVGFARQTFDRMPNRTLVSWNSMIAGLAANGHTGEALRLFDSIRTEGLEPDEVSFTGALTACSHSGLVERGLAYFEDMRRSRKIRRRIEHYGCVVDLYGRAGRLEEAAGVIAKMPMEPNEVVLGSLLAACGTRGDVALAEKVTGRILEADPGGDSNYVLLANVYAADGRWDRAGTVRKRMKELGIRKKPGRSSIEVDRDVREFVAGDKCHADSESVYSMIELLSSELRESGYVPENSYEHD